MSWTPGRDLVTTIRDMVGPERVEGALRVAGALERKLIETVHLGPMCRTLPTFLGIGAAQAGSSWLHANLERQPDVFVTKQKELRFFGERGNRPTALYSRRFRRERGHEFECRGEITPGYATLPGERIRFIRSLVPDVRLVYVIRNPVEREWSVIRRRLAGISEYGRVVRDVSEIDVDEILDYIRSRGPGSPQSLYVENLNRWFHHFDREQLLLIDFEDIRIRPEQVIETLRRHIGRSIRCPLPVISTKVNRNPARAMPPAVRVVLEKMYEGMGDELAERFGFEPEGW